MPNPLSVGSPSPEIRITLPFLVGVVGGARGGGGGGGGDTFLKGN